MKIKHLLAKIEELKKVYEDLDEWDVYLEQTHLSVPPDHKTLDEEIKHQQELAEEFECEINEEYVNDLKKSYEMIQDLEKSGWKFITDSEGWVYRETCGETGLIEPYTIFKDKKIFTINNNY